MPYTYSNGKWTYIPQNETGSSNKPINKVPPATKPLPPPPKIPKYDDNRETTETKDKSDKKFVEDEISTLQGDVEVVTADPTFSAKQTVKLTGLGKALTGLYYVNKVTTEYGSKGVVQTISVQRTGFGDSIKPGNVSKPSVEKVPSHANRPKPLENGYGKKRKISPPQRRTVKSTQQVRSEPTEKSRRVGEVYPGGWLECYEQQNGWYKMWFITFKRYGSKKLHAWVKCSTTKPI